ncbi:Mss4-like protein [Nemania serpens]|nr:Mss4-like protein [Nemania serpens]
MVGGEQHSTTASAPASTPAPAPAPSATYEAGCHCGYVKFAFALSPGLDEYKVMQCNCSACTRFGYLLVYPEAKDITWHNDGRARCATYRFNTKRKDHLFCPKCGASLGIDNRETLTPPRYGISVRAIYGVDVDKLVYKKGNGRQSQQPAGDLAGQCWDEERQEMR